MISDLRLILRLISVAFFFVASDFSGDPFFLRLISVASCPGNFNEWVWI